MHTCTLMHGKVSRRHLRGFACAKQSDMARFVLLIQYSPALCCSYIYKCGPLFGPWAALLWGNKNVSDEMLWIFVS